MFYGITNIDIISHGEWADPELRYTSDGIIYIANYWEVEDHFYAMFRQEYPNVFTEEDFYYFMQHNAELVRSFITAVGEAVEYELTLVG